ncbi:MAG: ABC transporter ATP-binding protein [Deltaproteobacteria bacterium]|nr:ABC transporter ATP-binding protein [Deltaproteobacteria bacterium]
MTSPVLKVEELKKTFKVGFARKVVDAVRGISFAVEPGEIFGFLGPNGAGKTTTIKTVMDLIRPTSGRVSLFGKPPGDMDARLRVGYLPEQPYFYDYLKPSELLEFFGKLYGIDSAERKRRIDRLLDRVGLGHAKDRTLRRFSKGMLQRAGLAQALIGNPDLVILDEPLSGLDPIGRKELKDVISNLRTEGKTVFFSSHILADIELLCDKIVIIDKGKLRFFGSTRDFLKTGRSEVEIVAAGVPEELLARVTSEGGAVDRFGNRTKIVVAGERSHELVKALLAAGADLDAVVPRTEGLEELFVRMAGKSEEAAR